MVEQIIDLKGEMSVLNVLVLHSAEQVALADALRAKCQAGGQFLERSPVVIDCHLLGERSAKLDFFSLRKSVIAAGLVPVGIRHLPEGVGAAAEEAGWALLRPSRTPLPPAQTVPAPSTARPAGDGPEPPTHAPRLVVIDRPVRSGQQVYCPGGDIVVMQQTSAGSELLAGGSVHVYGTLRGRVLAGIQGDASARIFCQRLEAELIAIAGRYRLLDEIDPALKGQAVMIYLDGEKLKIVPT